MYETIFKKRETKRELARVHWLLDSLPSHFKGAYILSWDYAYHRYVFYRMNGRKLYDIFIVVRTSKHYFRGSYCNLEYQEYEFFGDIKSSVVADTMYDIYLKDRERRIKLEKANTSTETL